MSPPPNRQSRYDATNGNSPSEATIVSGAEVAAPTLQGRQRRQPGRRPDSAAEERTAGRKRDLIAVAGRLFAERGFHGTSMADIAHEFGVRKATLYHWVESKESLLAQVLADASSEAAADMSRVVSLDLPAAERFRMMVRIHIESWAENPHNMTVGLSESRWLEGEARERHQQSKDAIETMYRKVLNDGRQSGEFELNPAELSLVLNSILGVMQWFPRWYEPEGWATPDYIANMMADLVLRGLLRRGTPPG